MVSTNYSTPSQVSTVFGLVNASTGVLLLETGDKLLLENGTDSLRIESKVSNTAGYTKSDPNATNYS